MRYSESLDADEFEAALEHVLTKGSDVQARRVAARLGRR
jgi:hypothetical protein